ncbi:MAG TPA: GNAT family N-acetyltransferase [bacterium]|nr:GNAT family N-acetyltransferase [bacterium]
MGIDIFIPRSKIEAFKLSFLSRLEKILPGEKIKVEMIDNWRDQDSFEVSASVRTQKYVGPKSADGLIEPATYCDNLEPSGSRFTSGRRQYEIWLFSFIMCTFPGCCAYGVPYNTYVDEQARGLGIGSLLQHFKIELAKEIGWSYLMCTTKADNDVQNHVLRKHGWERIDTRLNSRTNNAIHTWVKKV